MKYFQNAFRFLKLIKCALKQSGDVHIWCHVFLKDSGINSTYFYWKGFQNSKENLENFITSYVNSPLEENILQTLRIICLKLP